MVAKISVGAQQSARFAFKRNVAKASAGLHEEAQPRARDGSQVALIKHV
jgi:hypothetical protein